MEPATRPRLPEPESYPPPLPRPAKPVSEAAGCEEGAQNERGGSRQRTPPRRQRQLPLRTRIILGTAGGLLVVLGIAGLFLPFLQGILFLVLAAAVLSLTSRRIYRWLQGTVGRRWPSGWQRVERFRTRVRWKLRKK